LPPLHLHGAEKIECIELLRHCLEHAAVKLLGFAQLPLLLQGHGPLQQLTDVQGRADTS
jgi:hypothetical protein